MDETGGPSSDPDPTSDSGGGVAICNASEEQAVDRRRQLSAQIVAGLRDLDDSVGDLSGRVDSIGEFALKAEDLLLSGVQRQREEARTPLWESLFRLHDFANARARAIEAGESSPDPFCASLLASIEGELERKGVEVVRPEHGDAPQWALMHAVGKRDKPFRRRLETIAFVHRCGFAERQNERRVILRKADIELYS